MLHAFFKTHCNLTSKNRQHLFYVKDSRIASLFTYYRSGISKLIGAKKSFTNSRSHKGCRNFHIIFKIKKNRSRKSAHQCKRYHISSDIKSPSIYIIYACVKHLFSNKLEFLLSSSCYQQRIYVVFMQLSQIRLGKNR